MPKFRYLTSGESHGKALSGILEGIPAGLKISIEKINHELSRRQKGYGRSERMKLEKDEIEITGGVKDGVTTGAPISLLLKNKDYKPIHEKIATPRPGHADLAGIQKFLTDDITYISERASARETAMRTAIGAICKQFLSKFRIKIFSYVKEIGGIKAKNIPKNIEKIYSTIEDSQLRCPDKNAEKKMMKRIDKAKLNGDSLGGVFTVIAKNVPPGLGSHTQWDLKLDAQIAQAILSIQGVKGIEFGLGFKYADFFGSQVHDQVYCRNKKILRKTNNAGGIEGGISNGEDIVFSVVMKPISTLKKPLRTVNIKTKKPTLAYSTRADICAVPSCAVISENVLAIELTKAFLEKFGGDSIKETESNHKNYLKLLQRI